MYLLCRMMRSRHDGGGRTKGHGSADRLLQLGHYDQLIRAMRMEDSSSFFNYARMEPLEVGPRIQIERHYLKEAT